MTQSVFAENLDSLMKERKITNGMLSIKTGISEQSIWRYRNGRRNPGAYTVYTIAKALKVSVGWLLGEEEEKTNGRQ